MPLVRSNVCITKRLSVVYKWRSLLYAQRMYNLWYPQWAVFSRYKLQNYYSISECNPIFLFRVLFVDKSKWKISLFAVGLLSVAYPFRCCTNNLPRTFTLHFTSNSFRIQIQASGPYPLVGWSNWSIGMVSISSKKMFPVKMESLATNVAQTHWKNPDNCTLQTARTRTMRICYDDQVNIHLQT